MASLLVKTRQLNDLLQQDAPSKGIYVNYDHLASILSNMMECNTYILDVDGTLLGHDFNKGFECTVVERLVVNEKRMPKSYNEDLISTEKTLANLPNKDGGCVFEDIQCPFGNKITTIIPIKAAGERQGTLVIARFNVDFTDDDLILAEYGATILGMEIWRDKMERAEADKRERAAVRVALETLSFSEMEAIEHIFAELDGEEGLLVASKVADRAGITRSVIVNALRKFESAGVIESKSLGMKGTYIKVQNKYLLDAVKGNIPI